MKSNKEDAAIRRFTSGPRFGIAHSSLASIHDEESHCDG